MRRLKSENVSYEEYHSRYQDYPENEKVAQSLNTVDELRAYSQKMLSKRNIKNLHCFGKVKELKGHGIELGFNFGCSVMWLLDRYKEAVLDGIDFQDRVLKVVPLLRQMYGERVGEFWIGDTQDTGRPDDHYDFITALSIWEHLTDEAYFNTLKECYRILKPGGTIYVYVDGCEEKHRTTAAVNARHIRCVTLPQTVTEMQEAGFERVDNFRFRK